jgi:hypothetical protein
MVLKLFDSSLLLSIDNISSFTSFFLSALFRFGFLMLPKVLACIVLIVAILIDVKYVDMIIQPDIQLLLGTIIVGIIVFFDAVAGLILGIGLLVLYLRVYSKKYNIHIREIITGKNMHNYPNESLVTAYVTPAHLKDAQTNVVDPEKYWSEVKGFSGPYNEPVYGAQGIDSTMPGFGSPFPGESYESTGSGASRGGDGGVAAGSKSGSAYN